MFCFVFIATGTSNKLNNIEHSSKSSSGCTYFVSVGNKIKVMRTTIIHFYSTSFFNQQQTNRRHQSGRNNNLFFPRCLTINRKPTNDSLNKKKFFFISKSINFNHHLKPNHLSSCLCESYQRPNTEKHKKNEIIFLCCFVRLTECWIYLSAFMYKTKKKKSQFETIKNNAKL